MRKHKVPEEQIDHYLGHLPRGGAKMTRIYAPFEAEHCEEARAAIEAFVTEVRKYVKVADLDNPHALASSVTPKGRRRNGRLSKDAVKELEDLIRAGVGYRAVCDRFDISSPAFYKHRDRIFGAKGAAACRQRAETEPARKN